MESTEDYVSGESVSRPMLSPDEYRMRCELKAYELAERQLIDGTASPSVITHFLKLSTEREKKELAKLGADVELAEAKVDNLKSSKITAEATERVIEALTRYQRCFVSE